MKKWLTFVKSLIAGAAATLADIATFAALHHALGVDKNLAFWPAQVVGGIVNFIGNRRFAFQAQGGSLASQMVPFFGVTVISWVLTWALFHFTVELAEPYLLPDFVKLIASNAVYLGFSYPMFKRVFRDPAQKPLDPF